MKFLFSVFLLAIASTSQASKICEDGINVTNLESNLELSYNFKRTIKDGLIEKGIRLDESSHLTLEVKYKFAPPCRDKVSFKIVDANDPSPIVDISSSKCDVGGAANHRLSNIEKIGLDILLEIENCL